MAPRSQLEIHTASVLRLVKEEASYHRELKDQAERVQKLEAQTGNDDENREYTLKQEVCTFPFYSTFLGGEKWDMCTDLKTATRAGGDEECSACVEAEAYGYSCQSGGSDCMRFFCFLSY